MEKGKRATPNCLRSRRTTYLLFQFVFQRISPSMQERLKRAMSARVLHLRMQEVLASVVQWLVDTTLQQGFTDALTIYCL
eukprot:scaffold92862_cov61-Cyclotella_meneghiniana.AAC.1